MPIVNDHEVPKHDDGGGEVVEVVGPIAELLVRTAFMRVRSHVGHSRLRTECVEFDRVPKQFHALMKDVEMGWGGEMSRKRIWYENGSKLERRNPWRDSL